MRKIDSSITSGASKAAYLNEAKPVGPYTITVRGTFDGASVQVQAGPENNRPADFRDQLETAKTDEFDVVTDLSPETAIRIDISGEGAGTDLTFWIG